MGQRCRLCTANDREALVAELASRMWDSRRGGTLDDVPLEQAGDYWQQTMRQFAEATVGMLLA